MRRSAICGLGVAASWGMLACQSTPEAPPPPPTTGSEFSESAVEVVEVVEVVEEEVIELETVYFDFDRSEIRASARPKLRDNASAIRSFDGQIILEGNTDERGTEEYNLALGERRAEAVKRYLVDLGVPGAQLRTVSFGEDRPAVQGHDESAWRYNRRVDFAAGP